MGLVWGVYMMPMFGIYCVVGCGNAKACLLTLYLHQWLIWGVVPIGGSAGCRHGLEEPLSQDVSRLKRIFTLAIWLFALATAVP